MTMQQSSPPIDLPPKHVRAARALLAWSQQDLAKAAGVATSTVADFERGQRKPVANNAQAIREALENAGIGFLPNGAVIGPPIPRIGPFRKGAVPIRWVTADDLADWATRTDGVEGLPTLLAFLIRAAHGAAAQLRFPSNQGVRYSGWDGHVVVDHGSAYVPQGESAWEMSAQRTQILKKAQADYDKRSRRPGAVDPADAAFIFVTLRHLPQKDEWAKARRADGIWADVRVHDADDLVHWIEQTPAVGLWLAARLGKRPPGIRELDDFWEEWSLATRCPLTEELVLSDRDKEAAEVHQWLRREPSVLSMQATTADEAVVFLHAAVSMLPDDVAGQYRARTLVATDTAAARTLANAPTPQIIVLTEPDPGLAQSLAGRGHYVFQAYDGRPVGIGEVNKLTRPSRDGMASSLVAAGIPEPRARRLARDSARNLAVLRRLMPQSPGRHPAWAENPPRALLAAMLAGGWDERCEGDKARLAELANAPYDDVVAALAPFVGEFDSPLRKIGSTWRVASPLDAWVPLAPFVTAPDLQRFEAVATEVLGAGDPRFDMASDDRWLAAVKGVHPEYSAMLRHGVGQVLILLAMWGDKVRTVTDAHRRADAVVAALLHNADGRRWWSLSRDFRLLAEASPSAFLRAIEDSLKEKDPPIGALFGRDEGGIFGTEYLSDLLWALESLAWSPELLPRVSLALARLDAIDRPPGRQLNRPANSLRQIYLLWLPQTNATLEQRLKVLDLIRKRETNSAWKLMMSIFPHDQESSNRSPLPLWRDYSVDKVEPITWPLIGRGAAAVAERLVADVGVNPERWMSLIGRIADFAEDRQKVLDALEKAEPRITEQGDRALLWNTLREQLHHHRQLPDADWSLPEADCDKLERLYDRFAPADPLERVAWLFEEAVNLPNPSRDGWEAEQREVDQARRRTALAIFTDYGVRGILDLSRRVSAGGYLGKALYDAGAGDLAPLLEAAIRSADARERAVAHGLIISVFGDRKEPWAETLISKARAEGWGDTALMTIVRALPENRWTWEQAAALGPDLEAEYWRRARVWWIDDGEGAVFAIEKLISVGRARHAVALVGRSLSARFPSPLLTQVLREAARQPLDDAGDRNERTMFQHYVVEILKQLDARHDVTDNERAGLEWAYLPVLRYSRRPAKVLHKALSEQPSLFTDMIRAVCKPSEESGYLDPAAGDPDRAADLAYQAFQLLKHWNRVPGQRDDGTIDGEALRAWIQQARTLAHEIGRGEVADSRIGTILSASPIGADGAWPAEPVRDALELFQSDAIKRGFVVGAINRRGVTSRMPRDGGQLERQEATNYRQWATAIQFEYPYVGEILTGIADSYDWQARREDENAERLDWEI